MFRFDKLFEFISPFDYGIVDDLNHEVVDAFRSHLHGRQCKFGIIDGNRLLIWLFLVDFRLTPETRVN